MINKGAGAKKDSDRPVGNDRKDEGCMRIKIFKS